MSKPLPILIMIQHLDQGGTEHHLYDLVRGLDPARFETHLIYSTPGIVSARIEALGAARVSRIAMGRVYEAATLRTIAQVRGYVKQHGIRLIVTFHFVADLIGTLAATGSGIPVVSSRRDMGFTRTSRQKTMGRYLDYGVTRYIAVSHAVRDAIARDERVPAAKIETIHNGIDPAELERQAWDVAAERARHGIVPTDAVITCVANFNPVKGHVTLVEALAHMLREQALSSVKLLLAGDGPMRPRIEQAIAAHGLADRVVMLGLSAAVAREFQMADLVVLPSETEGFSNSIVQAMFYRKPVVACRVGGNPEAIVDGETGLLVPPKNPAELAAALGRLVREPALRRQMGEAAHARARREFTLDAMLRKTQDLFDRVCG